LGHRGHWLLHDAPRAGLFCLIRRPVCGTHSGIWVEPCHYLSPLFHGPSRVCLPHLALWPLIRPLRATPDVSARRFVFRSRLNPECSGTHALASLSNLGSAGRTGPEPDWLRPPPDADVVVVPPAAWSCLRAGAQWRQHGHADPRARGPVSGEWLRLAAGLHG